MVTVRCPKRGHVTLSLTQIALQSIDEAELSTLRQSIFIVSTKDTSDILTPWDAASTLVVFGERVGTDHGNKADP